MAHDDWAKMDARLDTSPKIRKAGRNGREVFLFLLRRNRLLAGGGADGRVPASNVEHWYLADQLMMSEQDAVDGVTRAVTAGLIAMDGAHVVICGFGEEWGGRVPLSDAERSRRYRERHGASREDRDASRDGRDESDASRRSEEKRGEEKRDGEARAPRRRPTTMPAGWLPNATHERIAAEQGVDMAAEHAKFSDFVAANDKRFADWDAGFRTWLRNAASFSRPRNGNAVVVPIRPRKRLDEVG